jgi:phage repressor protein C with HTH and peptisase S24 domain/ribosomal protein L40E
MALNPIVFTEKVVRSFLRYQLTAYPFADERLHDQMRRLLSLDSTRHSPLLKGPFISLSRPFRQGAAVSALVEEGVFHPHMRQRIPAHITHVYGHQEEAVRAIGAGRATLVSTGTGSGKTECFLYPIVSRCLELRDEGAAPGISAIIVYPMNALAEDQLLRLRGLLAGTGISFGMYVGKTPELETDVAGIRLLPGSSRADYEAKVREVQEEQRGETIYPPEEVCSREIMRTQGRQPRILLTNVKQLELLLTRQKDVELFQDARLDYLVFDEAHTFSGAQGAETACLIRRLRTYCGKSAQDTVCIATSATIVDRENPDAARDFASRFFGVPNETVTTVNEAYERDVWAEERWSPQGLGASAADVLADAVRAVEAGDDAGEAVAEVYRQLSGRELPPGAWPEALYGELVQSELLFQLSELLAVPMALSELEREAQQVLGRELSEAELLAWLTLGAAARKDGRPLVRPVVHVYVRGISGGVVSFPIDGDAPRLWLAAEDEIEEAGGQSQSAHFPLTTCTTCGQHYFIAHLKDFGFTGRRPEGGEAEGDGSFWQPLEEKQGGDRVVLLDRIVGGADDEDLDEHDRMAALYFCRRCGAAHPVARGRCLHCGHTGDLVQLYAVRQKEKNPGYLTSCLCCGANGRRAGGHYREPARPVRATNVADVHVLAQDMVHHSERPRLLVFCDNRQDAAFQAGWMKDHARRFRLRALMADGMQEGAVSVGDLSLYLDDVLEKDEALSRALVPEVWQVVRKEGGGGRHEKERRKFLRIQVLREVALSARQPIGLEPWGRMRVEYEGLSAGLQWIQEHARQLGMPAEDLREGVAGVLDYLRRKRILYDPEREIFTKYWMEGDLEVQQGYLSQAGGPCGTKLRREDGEKPALVAQWLSERGDTTMRQMARKWGVDKDAIESFLTGLFSFLREQKFIVPVLLKGSKGRPLPNVSGVYQLHADRLRLKANSGFWRCGKCRRRWTRRAPLDACLAWRCEGTLEFVAEDPDNYDLQLLDEGYSMLRPEEHTAMVPHDERERLENLFKGDSEAVNSFVCTPTLELGVDIGQLDSVLMRNVPPLPANYWQRAGRAGRRHRMAVDLTYCRPVSHDRAYFSDPLKLLAGRVDPPAFNLRNALMVKKHVHASVITRLHQYVRDAGRSESERERVRTTLFECLPARIGSYLFEDGRVRAAEFDLSPMAELISGHEEDLARYVAKAFQQGWPERDAEVTTPEALREHVSGFADELASVIRRVRRRLNWAMDQIRRLNVVREERGDLDPEDESLFRRCDALVKRLKGTGRRHRREAEGYDDSNTYGVLAAEGFLPGYGLEVGSVRGTAEIPFWRTGAMDFALPRPPSVALREYVPGNLIYANGNKFVARRFHRDADEQRAEMPEFEVSVERLAVKPTSIGMGGTTLYSQVLRTIAVCDVDLMHQSHISDEEYLRFQMPVAVYGYERDQHNGGTAFAWGSQSVQHRRGVRMRLVNVGAGPSIDRGGLGYPVCTVCGQSVSPLSSERARQQFAESHQDRCGRPVVPVGFYADVVADAFSLESCADHSVAYTVLEALRFAATRVLNMHMDDLQILVIGHVDRSEVDGVLWDPMPGGSGLIDQICERFPEVLAVAKSIVADCPSACETSCIDCLQTFRNSFYHKHLDRRLAEERIKQWGDALSHSHSIPALQPSKEPEEGTHPVNSAEARLRHLLRAAGFEEGIRGEQIFLDRAIGSTTPDIIYRGPHHDEDEGVCIYLDGLSAHLHGNPKTAEQDNRIRTWLRNHDYYVIEIAAGDLFDEAAMRRHFRMLAGYLSEHELRSRLKKDSSWFEEDAPEGVASEAPRLRLVEGAPEDRYVSCVPLVPLQAAAGAFGEPQDLIDEDWDEWVELEGRHKPRPGMFVAQVIGKSMEPGIPDGSYCLFSAPVEGAREGRIVLVQLPDDVDPETGHRYTVKRYRSEKVATEDGWRHLRISLNPDNAEFDRIIIECDGDAGVAVIAEFIELVV